MRTRATGLAAILIVTIGCTAPTSPSPEPTLESLAPLAAEHYRCDAVAFQPGVLLGAGHAERDQDAAAATLRDFLKSPLNDGFMPLEGWRRLGATATTVEFGNDAPDVPLGQGYVWVTLEPGVPTPLRWGSCQPVRVVPAALVSLAWWLPDGPPDPDARVVTIEVLADGCEGGPAAGDILEPLIDVAAGSVTVVLTAARTAMGCPSRPPTTFDVALPNPLGGRSIADGIQLPPRDGLEPPSWLFGAGG